MLIPLGSDVPLYHRPWGTFAIIAANVVLFLTFDMGSAADRRLWTLEFGKLLPWQWVTMAFSHAGLMHLLGNMIFLAVFGVIVEGKLGWYFFIPLYIGTAAAAGFVTQVVMLGADPVFVGRLGMVNKFALGASGVVMGLMAISFLWAPENEVRCIFILIVRVFSFEVRVATLCGLFIAWDLLLAVLDGFSMSTSVLHLLGAAAGVGVGVLFLKKGWVDCEGWDYFTRRRKRTPKPLPQDRESPARPQAAPVHAAEPAKMGAKALRDRIASLYEEGRFAEALAGVRAFLHRRPDDPGMCLLESALLSRRLGRPSAALRVLEALDAEVLTERQRAKRAELERFARGEIERGVIEISEED